MLFPLYSKAELKVGDRAPDFALQDQNGKTVRLSDFSGKKTVVLAFYIKANTPGWTKELTAYQADIANFAAAKAQVLGISIDKAEANRIFAAKIGATFPILSDPEKATAKAYGVLNFTRLFANRITFVIDKHGLIQHIDHGSDAMDPRKSFGACNVLEHKKQWEVTGSLLAFGPHSAWVLDGGW
jgi:thioredoxin-dependent peroxiredoxin